MTEDITKKDFENLCQQYPKLQNIGIEHLGPKIWILFNALKKGSVSISSISSRPCTSLMKNNITFEDIGRILNDLDNRKLLRKTDIFIPQEDYKLPNEIAYELQRLSFDLTQKIPPKHEQIYRLLLDCGYSSTYFTDSVYNSLSSDDSNKRTAQFKELLTEVAFSGLRLIIKLMNHTEKSLPNG